LPPAGGVDSLPFRADRKSTPKFGVEVSSFVVPVGDIPVINGVDVSKYQDAVDFEMLKACGGQFAYVRLSAGQRAPKPRFIKTRVRLGSIREVTTISI
jgi:GH25 family lysozyme M1 (1,4-beta-N-acetylmuramidase)